MNMKRRYKLLLLTILVFAGFKSSDGLVEDPDGVNNYGRSIEGEKTINEQCTQNIDCSTEGAICGEDGVCVCLEGLVECGLHDACIPAFLSMMVEMRNENFKWDDELEDKGSPQYQELADEISKMIKNAVKPMTLMEVNTEFEKSPEENVLSKVNVILRNPNAKSELNLRDKRQTSGGLLRLKHGADMVTDMENELNSKEEISDARVTPTGDIYSICKEKSDCKIEHAECVNDGACVCSSGYLNGGTNECHGEKKLGEVCSEDFECNSFKQKCMGDSNNKACKCESDSFEHQIKGVKECYPYARALNDRCTIDEQCVKLASSMCIEDRCACKPGFTNNGSGVCEG